MPGLLNPYQFAGGAPEGAVLVGTTLGSGPSPTIPYPAGAAVDDIALVLQVATSGGSGFPSGWSWGSVGATGINGLYGGKKLTAADILAGSFTLSASSGVHILALYRGPADFAVKGFASRIAVNGDVSPMSFAGITKNAASKALVALVGTTGVFSGLTHPAEMVNRAGNTGIVHDDANPAGDYTNGAALTYTYSGTPNIIGVLWELWN